MSSFRTALLRQLSDGNITTIDDLQTSMGAQRKKIQDNIIHATRDGLFRRLRDDVTGHPAYQITSKGREHLRVTAKNQNQDNENVSTINGYVSSCANTHAPIKWHDDVPEGVQESAGVMDEAQPIDLEAPVIDADQFAVFANGHLGSMIMPFADAQFLAMDNAKNGFVTTVYKLSFAGEAKPVTGAEWVSK